MFGKEHDSVVSSRDARRNTLEIEIINLFIFDALNRQHTGVHIDSFNGSSPTHNRLAGLNTQPANYSFPPLLKHAWVSFS